MHILSTHLSMGMEHSNLVPVLAEELFVFDCFKKRKSVFFKDVDPGCQWMAEHQRIYKQQKLNLITFFLVFQDMVSL